MKKDFECFVELRQDHEGSDGDDEKIADDLWTQIWSGHDTKEYTLKELVYNTEYFVRTRYRTNDGDGLYCDAKKFKTSLVLFIMFQVAIVIDYSVIKFNGDAIHREIVNQLVNTNA